MPTLGKGRRPLLLPPRLRLGRSLTRILPVLADKRAGTVALKTTVVPRAAPWARTAGVVTLVLLVLLLLQA